MLKSNSQTNVNFKIVLTPRGNYRVIKIECNVTQSRDSKIRKYRRSLFLFWPRRQIIQLNRDSN